MEFGVWAPVYGGWLRIKDACERLVFPELVMLTDVCENGGYDYLYFSENYLNCVYGASFEVADAWIMAAGVAARSERIKIVVATKPGFKEPLPLARMALGMQNISHYRFSINIVCGWWEKEFTQCNVDYLDHDKRYDRAIEFTECLQRLWQEKNVSYQGKYYQYDQATLANDDPSSMSIPVWISGHSNRAIEFAVEQGDVLFIDSMPLDQLKVMVQKVRNVASQNRKKIRIAMSAFVILDETDSAAVEKKNQIVGARDNELIERFKEIMNESGAEMWSGLRNEQMVDSNCGLDIGLVGSKSTIISQVKKLDDIGIDILMCQFQSTMFDAKEFSEKIICNLESNRNSRGYATWSDL